MIPEIESFEESVVPIKVKEKYLAKRKGWQQIPEVDEAQMSNFEMEDSSNDSLATSFYYGLS